MDFYSTANKIICACILYDVILFHNKLRIVLDCVKNFYECFFGGGALYVYLVIVTSACYNKYLSSK